MTNPFLTVAVIALSTACTVACGDNPDAVQETTTSTDSDSGIPTDSDEPTVTQSDEPGSDSEPSITPSTDEPQCGDNGWQMVYPPHGASVVSATARVTDRIVAVGREGGAVSLVDTQTGGWQDLPALPGTIGALVGRSPTELYAFHDFGVSRYDGATWQDLAFPVPGGGFWAYYSLFDGTDGGLYAAGSNTTLYVYRDSAWSALPALPSCPDGFTGSWLEGAWGTGESDLYAGLVCDCFKADPGCHSSIHPHLRLLHWNGAKWKVIDPSARGLELAVAGPAEAFGLVPSGDAATKLRHYKDGIKSAGPQVPDGNFQSLSVDPDGTIFLASDRDSRGVEVSAWRGGQWQTYAFPGGGVVATSVALAGGKLVVGEQRGRVSLLDTAAAGSSGAWTSFNGPASDSWQDIWGSAAAGMVAVGSAGVVLRGSGTAWTAQVLEGFVETTSVEGTSGGFVAVGGLHRAAASGPADGAGLWCGAPSEALTIVDLSSVPGDEATQLAWAEAGCDSVTDIASAPDDDRLYAACQNGWVVTLADCEVEAVEKALGAVDWLTDIAAGPDGELFVSARFSLSHRDALGWSAVTVPFENEIYDVWRAPDTGEVAILDVNANVFWWNNGVLELERRVPVGYATSMAGFAREDLYVLGVAVFSEDPTYLAHFDGEKWKWNDTQSLRNQRALAGPSSEDFYMVSLDGVIGRVCGRLFSSNPGG